MAGCLCLGCSVCLARYPSAVLLVDAGPLRLLGLLFCFGALCRLDCYCSRRATLRWVSGNVWRALAFWVSAGTWRAMHQWVSVLRWRAVFVWVAQSLWHARCHTLDCSACLAR